jgi:hypothetical protein
MASPPFDEVLTADQVSFIELGCTSLHVTAVMLCGVLSVRIVKMSEMVLEPTGFVAYI